jgi:hypothetical protein
MDLILGSKCFLSSAEHTICSALDPGHSQPATEIVVIPIHVIIFTVGEYSIMYLNPMNDLGCSGINITSANEGYGQVAG